MNKYFLTYKRYFAQNKKKPLENGSLFFSQFAGLGDAAVFAQFVANLIKKYKITIACRENQAAFWLYLFDKIRVIQIPNNANVSKNLERFAENNLSGEYERVFSLSLSKLGAYLSSFPVSGEKFGMVENVRYYRGAKRFFDKIHNAAPGEHVADRYKNLLKLGGIEACPEKLRLKRKKSVDLLIHPGAKWIARRWETSKWAELAQRFIERGERVKIVYGDGEKSWIISELTENMKNIEAQYCSTIGDLIENIAAAKVFAGCDSGPAHIANLLGGETIVLWGPGDFERIRPIGKNVSFAMVDVECRPCRQYVKGKICERGENVCMKSIEVESVYKKIEEKLYA